MKLKGKCPAGWLWSRWEYRITKDVTQKYHTRKLRSFERQTQRDISPWQMHKNINVFSTFFLLIL